MNIADKCIKAVVAAAICIASLTLAHPATASAAEPAPPSGATISHMPSDSQMAYATSSAATPQAIQTLSDWVLASVGSHAAMPAKCIIMDHPAGQAFFVEEPPTRPTGRSYTLTDI
ncbi:exported hypothetical protein [Actinacidiphila bryophytorum]|uniref:Uncharacterized protein n=1 Tax=Actinacidiphila bryophytorum TaxID=1436133 RepID=A0A9W4H1M0_9ACTN|nr:exported hypothetical protein [Actinacidiphila bryophytorum]